MSHHKDRFEWSAVALAVLLLVAIVLMAARGDQIGINVKRYGPLPNSPSTSIVQIVFDEAVDAGSVKAHFAIQPNVAGDLSIQDKQVIFRPATPFKPDTDYTVTLDTGIMAVSGRPLKQAISWQFNIRLPRIVYLAPAGAAVENLYVLDPADPTHPQQLTHSDNGILGYDVAPDGTKIVYSETGFVPGQDSEITLISILDVVTGQAKQVYECRAVCLALKWRPDSTAFAYHRVDLSDVSGLAQGAPRIWIYDLATSTAHPLYNDNQILGSGPQWSPDGTRLAFFSGSAGGILIHDFKTGKDTTIQDGIDQVGSFSPDGHWLYFPKIVKFADGNGEVHLALADLTTDPPTVRDLAGPAEPVSEGDAIWQADSKALIVARQPAVRELTQGGSLYSVKVETGKATLLVPDEGNNQANLAISPAGDAFVFERIALGQQEVHSSLWLYNFTTGRHNMIADQATEPAWLP